MEKYYSVIALVLAFVVSSVLIMLIARRINRAFDIELKLPGIWINESKTLRMVLHQIDSTFYADIVWVEKHLDAVRLLGFRLIKDLALAKFGKQARGVYTDPTSGIDYLVELTWSGNRQIKIALLSQINGRQEMVRSEYWRQMD